MDKPTECYVGKKKCGCVVWLCAIDMPPVELAESILEASQSGLVVERMATVDALAAFCKDCPHENLSLELETDGE